MDISASIPSSCGCAMDAASRCSKASSWCDEDPPPTRRTDNDRFRTLSRRATHPADDSHDCRASHAAAVSRVRRARARETVGLSQYDVDRVAKRGGDLRRLEGEEGWS